MTEFINVFIRFNYEDETEPIVMYRGELELFTETTNFYHDTFANEDNRFLIKLTSLSSV